MHPINELLSLFELRLMRVPHASPRADLERYEANLRTLAAEGARGYRVVREPVFEAGNHPSSYVDFECEFASAALARNTVREILDVGSYRMFVRGMTAGLTVTSIDVRPRDPTSANESVLTCDAKQLPLPDGSIDAIVSLCAIEHFGLGRYGDAFDPDGDLKALTEMKRVLRPGGVLVLSTTVTAGPGTIAFNAHRIYPLGDLRAMLSALEVESEAFYSRGREARCTEGELQRDAGVWDVYCGCWRKPALGLPTG